jgi:ATP-binding protein involved in chromosome partitioning
MTQQDVLQALSHVQEPDLGKDLVTLNMVKDIVIDGEAVGFTVVLTTPACPLKELIRRDCETAIHDHLGANLAVTVKFTANTSSNRTDGSPVLASRTSLPS